ncbi:hypothetical protein OIO90_002378 [Microbotryomycetes sp. JL221]|nr:hypothetical protein OIO90_002378 [Microbotryomycetes sp. JL221]
MSSVGFPMCHAHELVRRLLALPNAQRLGPSLHYIYVLGEQVQSRHDTDRELPFRQESNFAWLTGGVEVPGAAFTLTYQHQGGPFDPDKLETTLHLPQVDDQEVMWAGLPPTAQDIASTLKFTTIKTGWSLIGLYPNEQQSQLKTFIHHLPWTKPPSNHVSKINGPTSTSEFLIKALHLARRNKMKQELIWMKKSSEITAKAHTELMKAVGNQSVRDENEAEALFVSVCRKLGSKHQAYTPIMASGTSAGTLHYVSNEAPFPTATLGSLLLVDAGAEYRNYAADVTRCIPIGNGGKFTKECREIYELVLEMQDTGFKMIKPGADWEMIQKQMHQVAAKGLLKLGIFIDANLQGSQDDVVQTIIDSGLTTAFYPHGVGHLLGLDVHDVGGLPEGKSKDPLCKYLRLRVPLEQGFVVTVEPGIYFNQHLLKPHVNSPYLCHETLERYMYVGGVRIEDNVLVTENGFENLTPSWLPKKVMDVERVTSGQ